MAKYIHFFSFVIFFIFLMPFLVAQEQKIDVELTISTREFLDAYVVGDTFYYTINLTNTGNDSINDTFTISVLNPSKALLEQPRIYDIIIQPNESQLIIAEGIKEKNETAAFPFDISGDYRIEINSTQLIDFYRWIKVSLPEQNLIYNSYNRQTRSFNYYFDVMPRWQYNSLKKTKEANDIVINTNKQLLILTGNMNTATQKMVDLNENMSTATNAMVFLTVLIFMLTIVNVYYAAKTYQNAKRRRLF